MRRPRYSAPGVECGNLTSRAHSSLQWHHLATRLPAPLPHLILESTTPDPSRTSWHGRRGVMISLSISHAPLA